MVRERGRGQRTSGLINHGEEFRFFFPAGMRRYWRASAVRGHDLMEFMGPQKEIWTLIRRMLQLSR